LSGVNHGNTFLYPGEKPANPFNQFDYDSGKPEGPCPLETWVIAEEYPVISV
jgi:hypothetical protein